MLRFRTFGAIDLVDEDGAALASILAQPKRTALLVYLALAPAGAFRRRDTLVALFWPEHDESRARNALSQSLSFLRRHLPDGVLVNRGSEEIGVAPGRLAVDVSDFEQSVSVGAWAEALETYRDVFLQGLHVAGAPEFEEWMELERERLREVAAGAAWALAREQIDQGAFPEAERTAQRAMDLVSTDEGSVQAFIEALARVGDRAAAINFYERFATRLMERLDLEPSHETTALVTAIRNGELAEATAPRPLRDRPASAPTGTVSRDPVTRPPDATAPRPSAPRRRSGRLFRWLAPGGALLIVMMLWPRAAVAPDPHRVAVVPFRNQTADLSIDAVGHRMAEAIAWSLDRYAVGAVVPAGAVTRATRGLDPRDDPWDVLASRVGAGVVVTGDLFLEGDSIVARPRCLRSGSGDAIHAVAPVKRPLSDEAGLREAIQGSVTAALAQYMDTAFVSDLDLMPPPTNVAAFLEHRRGFEVLKLGGTTDEASRHFRRASELDSTYLAPRLRLLALQSSPTHGRDDRYEATLAALEGARHRMTRFQRHYYDGIRLSVDGRTELAYREFLAMAELSRAHAASGLAEMALLTNRPERAVEASGWLDLGGGEFDEPHVRFSEGYWSIYSYALHHTGRYRKQVEIALEWQDRWPAAPYGPVQSEAYARVGLGDLDPLDEVVRGWRLAGRLGPIWDLADELRVHGHVDEARTLLEGEVRRFDSDSAYIGRLNNQAMVLHRLDRNADAYALWEHGIRLDREPTPWAWGVARIGFSAALAGYPERAREMERLLLSLHGLPRVDSVYVPFMQAQIAAALGEKDRAVDILDAWRRSGRNLFWLNNIHRNYTLQSLLGDYPAFQELMRPNA